MEQISIKKLASGKRPKKRRFTANMYTRRKIEKPCDLESQNDRGDGFQNLLFLFLSDNALCKSGYSSLNISLKSMMSLYSAIYFLCKNTELKINLITVKDFFNEQPYIDISNVSYIYIYICKKLTRKEYKTTHISHD